MPLKVILKCSINQPNVMSILRKNAVCYRSNKYTAYFINKQTIENTLDVYNNNGKKSDKT